MDPYGILSPQQAPGAPGLLGAAMGGPAPLGVLSPIPAQPSAPQQMAATPNMMMPPMLPGSRLSLTPDLIQRVLAEMAMRGQLQAPAGGVSPDAMDAVMQARRMGAVDGVRR